MRLLFTVAVAVAATAGPACSHPPASVATAREAPASSQSRVPGEYLVTLATGADVKAITDVYGPFGIKRIQDSGLNLGRNVFLMALTEDPGPAKMEEVRRQDARIEAVQPNFVYRATVERPRP